MSRTILIVEDYEDTRSCMKFLIESYGYEVVEAADGLEAVESFRDNFPDLVLMDISMPRLDGCAAMLRIHENEGTRGVPVIVISAFFEYAGLHPLLRMDAIRAGFAEYITKPFDPAQLEYLVSRLLPTG